MVNLGKIHTGDIGTELQLKVEDTDVTNTNQTVDLSQVDGATPLWVILTDPDGNKVEFEAEFLTDGTDGYMSYTTEGDIWTQAGYWKKRPRIEYVDGRKYSGNDVIFEVL